MNKEIDLPPDTTVKVAEAVDLVEQSGHKEDDDLITLSTGVVLRAKQVPPALLIKVMAYFTRPKAPVYWNEQTQSNFQNPDHPDHIDAVQAYELEYSDALFNVLLLKGTEVVDIPTGFPTQKSNGWIEELELIGIDIFPEKTSWRYLMWLVSEAIKTSEDFDAISKPLTVLSGVPEEDVANANRFPGSD